ncbi:PAS domain S-box protein [Pseudodesulfovibrio sp. S3]|nr:PAS domain S-box protein [Pseudodesulfovibrio sp. S3]
MNSTILVVDSDASIRTLIHDVLSARGYRVEAASSPASAAAFMARHDPDLIFASFGKGEDEGSLVREAGKLGQTAPVILVVDAGFDDAGRVVEACGAMAYLKKPVNRMQLEMLARQGVALGELRARVAAQSSELIRMKSFMQTMLGMDGGMTLVLDAEAIVLERGGQVMARLQVDIEQCVGVPYLSLFPGPVARLHAETIAKVRASGQAARLEEHRGGMVMETEINPVSDGERLSGFVVCVRDITAKRRSEVGLAESEKQYRSVFEGAAAAIILIDRDRGVVIECNEAAARALGYGPGEMHGINLRDLVAHPDKTLQAMGHGTERISYDYLRRKNGSSFPVEMSLSYYTNAGREVCILYAQDISRRKIVEEALREGARLYRAVVEDQTELICRYAPNGTLTFVNDAYERFLGLDEDEILGRDFFSSLGSVDHRALTEWLAKSDSGQAVLNREIVQVRNDGDERWIQWTHRAIFNDRKDVVEIQAVGRDITERKDAEQALNQATLEKEQYRSNLEATFASIPDAILTVDSDLSIMATNSAAKALFGFERDQARGLNLNEVVEGDGNPCVNVLKQVLKTDKPVRGYEIELDTPSLGGRMVEINCSPLVGKDKQQTGAVLIVRDVSHIADLEKQLQQRQGFRGIVGRSSPMQDVYHLLEQLSPLDSTVLILGESGTGKELVAEALHYGGARAGKPLIKVNCSALSENLLESELFGHVRGAFTGAVRDKVGRIQAAQGGTLFLDEIGDISPMLQLKLLRFLEQKEYERVGESKTCTANVRIIAATNVDLRRSVRQGVFREDLYYRLNVMPVSLPPLRERQADIPLLVEYFLGIFSNSFSKQFEGVSEDVMDLFLSYGWPGNVRELRHTLEHACILSPGKIIGLKYVRKDLVECLQTPVLEQLMAGPAAPLAPFVSRRPGRDDILSVLEQCGGNKARAARELGIHRATLYRKLAAWGIDG